MPALELAHERAADRLEAHERLAEVAERLETATGAVEQARTEALAARNRTHRLRHQWIGATAAGLVGELVEGEPCPVCGSPEHPVPPTEEEWEAEKTSWIESMNRGSEQQAVQAFLTDLRNKADVRIINPAVLEN